MQLLPLDARPIASIRGGHRASFVEASVASSPSTRPDVELSNHDRTGEKLQFGQL
jgi:hypothetical protein